MRDLTKKNIGAFSLFVLCFSLVASQRCYSSSDLSFSDESKDYCGNLIPEKICRFSNEKVKDYTTTYHRYYQSLAYQLSMCPLNPTTVPLISREKQGFCSKDECATDADCQTLFELQLKPVRQCRSYCLSCQDDTGLICDLQSENGIPGVVPDSADCNKPNTANGSVEGIKEMAGTERWCAVAPISPADRRTDPYRLTIAQYNAEWLFYDRKNCPSSSCEWENIERATAHFNSIATQIKQLNADIINLVEIQDCGSLQILNQLIGPEMGYKPYLIQGDDSATGQNIGILTRIDPMVDLQRTTRRIDFPVSGSKCGWNGGGTKGCSKHYYTRFNVSGEILHMAGVHLLAHPSDQRVCVQREAQALVVKEFIQEQIGITNNDTLLVVIGDMNDYDEEVRDSALSVPISKTLSILKSSTTPKMRNAMEMVEDVEERYSAWWDKNQSCVDDNGAEHTAIDHILLSPQMSMRATQMKYIHQYGNSCGTTYSDHWPLVITFNWMHVQKS